MANVKWSDDSVFPQADAGAPVTAVGLQGGANVKFDLPAPAPLLAGVSGSFTTTDLKTVTVTNGVITDIT